jgi:hypothetical protein
VKLFIEFTKESEKNHAKRFRLWAWGSITLKILLKQRERRLKTKEKGLFLTGLWFFNRR